MNLILEHATIRYIWTHSLWKGGLLIYQTIYLDFSKLKASAVDKLNMALIAEVVFNRVESIVGNGENAGYTSIFSFSHNVFS